MKDDVRKLLEQILMFAKRIESGIKDVDLENFIADTDKQDAILYRLGQIGETANKVSDQEQEKYPNLFWDEMIGLRNRLFHDYYEIDLKRIYDITGKPISQLIKNLEGILESDVCKP